MSTNVFSRAAIQARIAEWQRQRQYQTNDYGLTGFLFGDPRTATERVRWLQCI